MKRVPWVPLGIVLGLVAFGWFLANRAGSGHRTKVLYQLLVGWAEFPRQVLPRVTVNVEAILTACACLALFLVGFHFFCRWLHRHREASRPSGTAPTAWRFSWTATFAALVALLFVAGLSAVGLARQVTWLMQEPMIDDRDDPRSAVERLHRLGEDLDRYKQFNENTLPPGESLLGLEGKYPPHSWTTQLMRTTDPITLFTYRDAERWDSPWHRNVLNFAITYLLNPDIPATNDPKTGYGLCHVSANQFVMGPGPALKLEEVTDGLAQTFLLGQVAANFSPWGKPGNWRDPGLGINASPDGFGAPGPGALMMMCDGSVRFFANETDKAVLKALATPAGGEKTPALPPAR